MNKRTNTSINRPFDCSRRAFIRKGVIFSTGMVAGSTLATGGINSISQGTFAPMPEINLGGFRISKLILGTNPFWGFWHGNPRKPQKYTEEGKKAVMDAAAEQGITAIWSPGYKEWITLWKEYKDNGGRLKTWMGQPDGYNGVSVENQITACFKNGGGAVCIQGVNVDDAMKNNDYEKLRRWLGLIHDCGLPAGLASHQSENILKAEDQNLPTEFYHLTVGVPDSFTSEARDKTLQTVRQIDKPMMVYKVFGAGRFEPGIAFPYVLKAIRKNDGLCVGVDDPLQVAENAEFVRRLA